MKKFWKLSACALAATFTFSAVTACGDKGETEEKSNITADQVLALGDSIAESLADVQSFNFGFSMKSGQSSSEGATENGMDVTATVNLTEMNMDAKMAIAITEKMSIPGYNYNESTSLSAYLIDGFGYMQAEDDETGKTFEKSPRPVIDFVLDGMSEGVGTDLSEILEEVLAVEGEIAMPEIPMDLIKDLLNDEFILVQKGNTTRVTLDLKKDFNEFFAFVGGWTTDTKVGDVVNYALGHIDEGLTWQDITGAIKNKGGYTVGTLINILDNELYNSNGVRLQDIKDMMFAEPGVYDVLVQEMGKEMTDMIVNTTVAQFVSQYGGITIDNVVQMIGEDETLTLSTVVGMIESVFAEMTLGDTFETEEEALDFIQAVAILKGVRADELNANLIFTVKDNKIMRVETSYNVKITISVEGETMTTYMNTSIYAEGFSSQAQTIALPTGSTVVIYCYDCGLTATENDYCELCRAYVCADCHETMLCG